MNTTLEDKYDIKLIILLSLKADYQNIVTCYFYLDNFIIILKSIVILLGNEFGCCHIQIIYDHIVTKYYGSKFVVACYARIGTLSLILDISLSCIKENGFITCK